MEFKFILSGVNSNPTQTPAPSTSVPTTKTPEPVKQATTSTNSTSSTSSSIKIYSDDIYREAESNGLATAICKAIDIATQLMVPLFAIMFSILGLRAFQGKMELSVFFTFAIGIAAFKGAGSILEFLLPDMGLQYGCNCAVVRYIRNSDGVVNKMETGLNEDCSDIAS